MRRVSAKRAKQLSAYRKLRDAWLEEHNQCEAPMCLAKSTEVHHSRGRIGLLLCDVRFWIALCPACHKWVHENPAKARAAGMLAKLGDWNKVERL